MPILSHSEVTGRIIFSVAYIFYQAFMELTTGDYPRLLEENTDVKSYVVDNVPHLARIYSPY